VSLVGNQILGPLTAGALLIAITAGEGLLISAATSIVQ
jgi:hypothetical protein